MPNRAGLWPGLLPVLLLVCLAGDMRAADAGAPVRPASAAAPAKGLADALSPEKWREVENSVDRGLAWIASQQAPDGSFPTFPSGQPAISSLCVMAFLSRGHQPGFGPYGQQLNRAIDFVLSCQREDGLFSLESPGLVFERKMASHTASYNHAIAGLMLGEVYGHVSGERARRVKAAIAKAIEFTRALQVRPKAQAKDAGGWRYLPRVDPDNDSDLSITAWHLMFLRSARNAEFKVPQQYMDEGIAFVRRCWDPSTGMFNYLTTAYGGTGASRGTTGAGILSLSMAGQHNTPMALAAGDWLVAHPYGAFGESYGPYDKFFYSIYYCSQAAAQLGGHYWEKFFPPVVNVFLKIQKADGSFPPEPLQGDAIFGSTYTTAVAVLALTPAYQLLPVYQR
jgi:prenyltransferase beta subunit